MPGWNVPALRAVIERQAAPRDPQANDPFHQLAIQLANRVVPTPVAPRQPYDPTGGRGVPTPVGQPEPYDPSVPPRRLYDEKPKFPVYDGRRMA